VLLSKRSDDRLQNGIIFLALPINLLCMDTWMIIFYIILAATIVSYTILMNYKKDRNEFMETRDQADKKGDGPSSI
jgi:hypothetical protein